MEVPRQLPGKLMRDRNGAWRLYSGCVVLGGDLLERYFPRRS